MSCVVLMLKGNPRVYGMISSNTIQTTRSTPTLFEYGTTIEDLKEIYNEAGARELVKELDNFQTVEAAWSPAQ